MPKFYGDIGYAGEKVETAPGVWSEPIVVHKHKGEVIRNSRKLEEADKVNMDLSVGNSISIIADAYAREHFWAMRYIKWSGVNWVISNVTVEHPRLILRLGGLYNGPTG